MSDSIIEIYRDALSDKSVPECRIFRKTFGFAIFLCVCLVIYRHIGLGFSSLESIIGTLLFLFIGFFVVSLFGGMASAYLYSVLRKYVKVAESGNTFKSFVIEWLLTILTPIFGAMLFTIFSIIADGA